MSKWVSKLFTNLLVDPASLRPSAEQGPPERNDSNDNDNDDAASDRSSAEPSSGGSESANDAEAPAPATNDDLLELLRNRIPSERFLIQLLMVATRRLRIDMSRSGDDTEFGLLWSDVVGHFPANGSDSTADEIRVAREKILSALLTRRQQEHGSGGTPQTAVYATAAGVVLPPIDLSSGSAHAEGSGSRRSTDGVKIQCENLSETDPSRRNAASHPALQRQNAFVLPSRPSLSPTAPQNSYEHLSEADRRSAANRPSDPEANTVLPPLPYQPFVRTYRNRFPSPTASLYGSPPPVCGLRRQNAFIITVDESSCNISKTSEPPKPYPFDDSDLEEEKPSVKTEADADDLPLRWQDAVEDTKPTSIKSERSPSLPLAAAFARAGSDDASIPARGADLAGLAHGAMPTAMPTGPAVRESPREIGGDQQVLRLHKRKRAVDEGTEEGESTVKRICGSAGRDTITRHTPPSSPLKVESLNSSP
ncbi:hypothetical protein B0H12DRAFT_223066 [Mycena haematopus]|nr:hypothetical protein B0H12DRAFT_223066 [Mycena haematopus]